MTKQREPLSFAAAVTTVAALVGWERLAEILGRSERSIRYWSDDDYRGQPSLAQAVELDRAFIAAGGNHAPMLGAFASQLNMSCSVEPCATGLATDISAATRETAEAISISINLIQPGATLPQKRQAVREINEGIDALNRVRARVNSLIVQDGGAKFRGSRTARLYA